jgi:deazaflavin-dependent oxidoreductase (nitroreductase family)
MASSPAAEERYCYLTTTGRVSGEPREIEIWFGLEGSSLYMLAEGRERSNWVRNLLEMPEVTVRIGDRTSAGRAAVVTEPGRDVRARRLLFDKYSPAYSGDLAEWRDTALVVAVELG